MSRKAEKYFEEVPGKWEDRQKGFYGDEVRDAVLAAAKVLPSDTVLDVGAGTGFLTEGAAKIARKVIALDFSETMTGESRMKLGGRNVEFKIGNVEQIPLRDASVDAVIGNMILHHCLNPDIAVRDMAPGLVSWRGTGLFCFSQHKYWS